jgi:PAS domain S-box-containing protein
MARKDRRKGLISGAGWVPDVYYLLVNRGFLKRGNLFEGRTAMMNMVLVTIITVLISGTFYLRERVSNKARDRVARTYEVRVHLNAVADKIKNLELGHYGYLITDDASFLKTYNQELGQESSEATTARSWSAGGNSLFDEFHILRESIADNPEQRENLDLLEQLILRSLAYSDSTLRLRKEQGLETAAREIGSRKGLALTDSIDGLIAAMVSEEQRIYNERLAAEERHLGLNRMLMYAAIFVFFVGLIIEVMLSIGYRRSRRQAQLELQEHEILLRAIMDGNKHGIFSTDRNGIIISFNRAAERMLGYEASHFVGKTAGDMMDYVYNPEELRERAGQLSVKFGRPVRGIEVFLLPLKGRDVYEQEWTVLRSDGIRIPISLTVTALRDSEGEIRGYLGIAQDITERKEVDRVKNEFISTVSHELRTPLTSIRGALGLVGSGAVGSLSEKAAELVAIARKNSERLVLIINDILDIKKMESGKLSLRIMPVSVSETIHQALEANRHYGDKYSVNFVQKRLPDARVMADPDRLMQILANLLSNAAKFSPPGSEVWVGAESRNGRVHFSIRDFGPGISEEFRPRIFQKFAQADHSDTRFHEGTGLGLSIAKNLVEAMGGSIRFETTLGKGTTFFFELPQEHVSGIHEGASGATELVRQPVLVCEDDRDVATLLKIWLDKAGFSVDSAYSLQEAREKMRNHSYAAMTLDLMLPDGSGLDLIREIRVNPATSTLPVVVVSVKAETDRKSLDADALGVADWLSKPIDEQQLVGALRRAISGMGQNKPSVLHVEDDLDLVHIIGRSLQGLVDLTVATTIREAEKWLKIRRFDLVVLDLSLPDGSALELLDRLTALTGHPVPVLILSAHETDETVHAKVKAVLIKSRMSEARIVETILSLVGEGQFQQQEES